MELVRSHRQNRQPTSGPARFLEIFLRYHYRPGTVLLKYHSNWKKTQQLIRSGFGKLRAFGSFAANPGGNGCTTGTDDFYVGRVENKLDWNL